MNMNNILIIEFEVCMKFYLVIDLINNKICYKEMPCKKP